MQIDKGSEVVKAAIRNSQNTTLMLGSVIAKSGCWSMIKGGVTPNESMQANLYFEVFTCSFVTKESIHIFCTFIWRSMYVYKSLKECCIFKVVLVSLNSLTATN